MNEVVAKFEVGTTVSNNDAVSVEKQHKYQHYLSVLGKYKALFERNLDEVNKVRPSQCGHFSNSEKQSLPESLNSQTPVAAA